jgi:hypothetical protein
VVLEANDRRVEPGVLEDLPEVREALHVRGVESIHLGLDLLRGGSGSQSTEVEIVVRMSSLVGSLLGSERERPPRLHAGVERLDPAGHHADHGVRLPVEAQMAADRRRVAAEDPPPQCVAQEDHLLVPDLTLGVGEGPAQGGTNGHHAEKGRSHIRHADPGGKPVQAEGEAAVIEERLVLERGDRAQAVIVVGDARDRTVGDTRLRVAVAHQDDPVRLGNRKRTEEDVVDHGEEGGVCPDTQGEGQNHRDAERAIPQEQPQSQSKVACEPVHEPSRARGHPSITVTHGSSSGFRRGSGCGCLQ